MDNTHEQYRKIALIADELERMVSHGLMLRKLASMPEILKLTGMPEDTKVQVKAKAAFELILAAIARITGTHGLNNRPETFTADQVKSALKWLLKIGYQPSNLLVEPRREKALSILGTRGLTADTWRRLGSYRS